MRPLASSFGTVAGGILGKPFSLGMTCWSGRAWRSQPIFAARICQPADTYPARCSGRGKVQVVRQNEATAPPSTGIGDDRQGQGEEEQAVQIDSCTDRMCTAMQIAPPIKSLQRERQASQQPDDEQAALVVVADML